MTSGATRSASASFVPGRVIALLTLAMFLNYADRGSLSTAAPVLGGVLRIGDGAMGVLLSAFFWTYAVGQPISGWLAQRYGVRAVMAWGLGLWAGATLLCGLASGFVMLFALRLVMGAGESVMFPCNAALFARSVPVERRARVNSAMSVAIAMGPSAGTLVGGLLLVRFGWQAVFVVLGALTLLWLVPWLRTAQPEPVNGGAGDEAAPSYAAMFRRPSLWGASLGAFCYSYPSYLMLTWLPLFLVKQQRLSLAAMAGVAAGIYAANGAAAVVSGFLSDRMIAGGADASRVRKAFMIAGVAGTAAGLLGASLSNAWIASSCIALSTAAAGFAHPQMFTIGQTLSGPAAGGRWMGVQNFFANVAGIVAPIATGFIVQASGSFAAAFAVAAMVSAIGIAGWAWLVRRVEPEVWRTA